jgi:hypothetical protein
MRRRKNMGGSMRNTDGSPMLRRYTQETQIFHVKGKRPAARDGHTGVIFGEHLIIFGGDRHHMPFNDSYVFNIAKELEQNPDGQ